MAPEGSLVDRGSGRIVRAHQNEPLDALVHRHFGRTAGIVEQVLQINPGLADLGPRLPQGTPVRLPELPETPTTAPSVSLWD